MAADPRAEAMSRVLETERAETHTAIPATILAYDKDTQTATIRLGVRAVVPSGDPDVADTTEAYPDLHSVPVLFPGSGTYFLAWGLREGDTGLAIFCHSDIGEWRAGDGAAVDPGVASRHAISNAVFIPGLNTRQGALSDAPGQGATRWGIRGGTQVEIVSGTIRAGGTKALAEADDVKAHLTAISTQIATICAALTPALIPSYVYATVLATNPIETSILKGD